MDTGNKTESNRVNSIRLTNTRLSIQNTFKSQAILRTYVQILIIVPLCANFDNSSFKGGTRKKKLDMVPINEKEIPSSTIS